MALFSLLPAFVAILTLKQVFGTHSRVHPLEPAGINMAREGLLVDVVGHFKAFITRHDRQYKEGTDEYNARLALFANTLGKIDRANSVTGRLWTAGINKLSDRSDKELAQLRGWKASASGASQRRMATNRNMLRHGRHSWRLRGSNFSAPGAAAGGPIGGPLPSSVSYADRKNAFSRDQGACGSCWAVTTTTLLGYHSEIHMRSDRQFSTQELLNCVPNPNRCGGGGGCDGATVELAMQYSMLQGLGVPEDTPYTGRDGSCKKEASQLDVVSLAHFSSTAGVHMAPFDAPGRSFGMAGWEKFPMNKYKPLMIALYELGPVGVSFAADDLYIYNSGIYDCMSDASYSWIVNHAMTLIGYGEDNEAREKYYLLQNSWGPEWGEDGMVRVRRLGEQEDEHCGMDDSPQEGVACEGETAPVKVCGTCGILYDSVAPIFSNFMPLFTK